MAKSPHFIAKFSTYEKVAEEAVYNTNLRHLNLKIDYSLVIYRLGFFVFKKC